MTQSPQEGPEFDAQLRGSTPPKHGAHTGPFTANERASQPGSVVWVRGLQRSIGNAGVARLLASSPSLQRVIGIKNQTRVMAGKGEGRKEGTVVADIKPAGRYRVEFAGGKQFTFPYDEVDPAVVPHDETKSAATGVKKDDKNEKKDERKDEKGKGPAVEKKAVEKKAVEAKPQRDGPGSLPEDYARRYQDGIRRAAETIILAKPRFERSDAEKAFNTKCWTLHHRGLDSTELRLRSDCPVIAAIDDLLENAPLYTFDCASFVQAVELHAWRSADPKRVAALKSLTLREHDSTGISHRRLYFRDSMGAEMRLRTPESDKSDAAARIAESDAKLLRAAPIGSRVSFKNYDGVAEDTNWERENSVKVGDDTYAAFPLGIGTEKMIKEGLAHQALLMHLSRAYETLEEKDQLAIDVIAPDTARRAEVSPKQIGELVGWIFAQPDKVLFDLSFDDLDEYIDYWIELEQIEIYGITPDEK